MGIADSSKTQIIFTRMFSANCCGMCALIWDNSINVYLLEVVFPEVVKSSLLSIDFNFPSSSSKGQCFLRALLIDGKQAWERAKF